MLKATKFEILRQVDSRAIDLPAKPLRVATLLNEQDFLGGGCILRHRANVFLEDQRDDWSWKSGKFRYFSRVANVADVLIVYELESAD